ncbi:MULTISPECIES: carbohydrate kinase family protein [Thalassotalea]|uniref:carbohydrate kinase family protein n=1 Tax=Thalassotalea TaxID=1518149 RepID=UPI000942EB54|nr:MULTISPECIES: carbohydrate kinase [Thalassotalea]OKY26556.1 carbohydrate kinase [Thalassotalea sp. PP2-459]
MKPVLCFGEALIDFLNTGKQEDGPLVLNNYRQYPGGAPANAAVAVAKLGGKALFAGQVGNDAFGHFLEQALIEYGVDTQFLTKHPSAKTALAFVMLDSEGDRSFSFYRDGSADVLFSEQQIDDKWYEDQPLFHFCSNTLTDKSIAIATKAAVTRAKAKQSLVSFDVNLRHNLWSTGQANVQLVNELVYISDIVKFSRDELEYLAQGNNQTYIQSCLDNGVSLLVITDGEHPIEFYSTIGQDTIPVPDIKAVDTTAGGDAFSGSLLFALSKLSEPKTALFSMDILRELITFASNCGAHTVTLPGAFPALPRFSDIEQHWPTDLYL